jgi:hypothetical protein
MTNYFHRILDNLFIKTGFISRLPYCPADRCCAHAMKLSTLRQPFVKPRPTLIEITSKDFNFVIAKFSVTTKITEFREIRPKFRRIFFRD